MQEFIDEYYKSKEDLYNYIINSNESKLEKLNLIHTYNLLTVADSWEDPMYDAYYDKYIKKLEGHKKLVYNHWIIDDFTAMNDFSRGSTFIPHEWIECYEEGDMIDIYSNRSNNIRFSITKQEFIDTLYNWTINNKLIGFTINW